MMWCAAGPAGWPIVPRLKRKGAVRVSQNEVGRRCGVKPVTVSRARRRRVTAALMVLTIVITGCGDPSITALGGEEAESYGAELASQGVALPTWVSAALFGDDGGHICAAAGSRGDLANVVLVGHRFALRKTTVSEEDVAVNRAVIDVYCPEHRGVFDEYVAGLKTGHVSDG